MKRIVSIVLALVLIFSLSATAFAEVWEAPVEEIVANAGAPGNSPQAEETTWVTRWTDDGLIQKRLWSLTYGVWLTDWITVGYWDP